MSSFADRIRAVVGTQRLVQPTARPTSRDLPDLPDPRGHPDLSAVLGGDWREIDGRKSFVVERRWPATRRHGRVEIGRLADELHEAALEAPMFADGAPARPPLVFFDLETTGLSGGAGTLAFLVGCGVFEGDRSFVTRQFVLTNHSEERPLLETVGDELVRAGALVTFNGKSFDAPLLETRYLFHRLGWVVDRVPHIDVLHPSRRFWGADVGAQSDCSLTALERRVLGVSRAGDISGLEVPSRYFQFIRSGDPRPLVPVLDHNRMDLLTLAALTARLLRFVRSGPELAVDAREAYALGTVYARAGLDGRARDCYARAIELCRAPRGAFEPVRIGSLRALAIAWRRARCFDTAASCWRELLETRGCPAAIYREAAEALAIHHEHRIRDLAAARVFALRSLDRDALPAWTEAVRHRVRRIERKMNDFRNPELNLNSEI